MLVLKLRRVGKRHQPSYRLVVAEKRSKINGKFIDNLGWYNPRSKQYQFNKERVLRWLQQGAQRTDTVHNLLIRAGIIMGKKIAVHNKAKDKVEQSTIKNQQDKNMDEQMNPTPEENGGFSEPVEHTEVHDGSDTAPVETPVEHPSEETVSSEDHNNNEEGAVSSEDHGEETEASVTEEDSTVEDAPTTPEAVPTEEATSVTEEGSAPVTPSEEPEASDIAEGVAGKEGGTEEPKFGE